MACLIGNSEWARSKWGMFYQRVVGLNGVGQSEPAADLQLHRLPAIKLASGG